MTSRQVYHAIRYLDPSPANYVRHGQSWVLSKDYNRMEEHYQSEVGRLQRLVDRGPWLVLGAFLTGLAVPVLIRLGVFSL